VIRVAVFDLDGVVLESTQIKTEAFRLLFSAHEDHVDEIVALHERHAGVSRYEKFRMIHRDILGTPLDEAGCERLGEEFSALVLEQVLACDFVPGARELLEGRCAQTPLYVASGTPEDELRHIVSQRGLDPCFAGVYGTPPTKGQILRRILGERGIAPEEALFVGDAMTDLEGAREAGVPFVGRAVPGEPDPFDGEAARVVADMAELDAAWEELVAEPPPVPRPVS
jgi:phosphoglycolate phosphatase-like HAD superfamily hydrolase